jgi:gamma-D-glutamyl-L-lysine dipeptidyl-peptidase
VRNCLNIFIDIKYIPNSDKDTSYLTISITGFVYYFSIKILWSAAKQVVTKKYYPMEQSKYGNGISLQGYIPVRSEPRESAEMVTQVLFGEYMEILEEKNKWFLIRVLSDRYEGWVDKKCVQITEEVSALPNIVTENCLKVVNVTLGHRVILPLGSRLTEPENGRFFLAGNEFLIDEPGGYCKPGTIVIEDLFDKIVSIPYLWGGRCGFGFDCSGLTQFLCRVAGKEIPRDASDQSATGQTLNFIHEAGTGDLAFFDNEEGRIHHVGMFIGNNRIIHASGTVRIDRIDQQGIYNDKLGRYTYKLRVIKRVL